MNRRSALRRIGSLTLGLGLLGADDLAATPQEGGTDPFEDAIRTRDPRVVAAFIFANSRGVHEAPLATKVAALRLMEGQGPRVGADGTLDCPADACGSCQRAAAALLEGATDVELDGLLDEWGGAAPIQRRRSLYTDAELRRQLTRILERAGG